MRKILLLVVFSLIFAVSGCNKDDGNDVTGTQGGNNNPNIPSNPSPTDGATNVNRFGINLSWTGGDPNTQDTVWYDVYAGVNSANTLLSDDQLATSYSITVLQANTTFKWKIVAKDNSGLTTDGPEWTFTTGP
jgi:hypothetical protein